MKTRPILFCAPMVRAILEGRKTQTRRVCKPAEAEALCEIVGPFSDETRTGWFGDAEGDVKSPCPYGQPGDRLWVRETWRIGAWNEAIGCVAIDYKADGHCRREWIEPANDDAGEIFNRLWQESTDDAIKAYGHRDRYEWEPGQSPCRWRSPRFMPRWASRITLEITDIRVERLQAISEAAALAEGCHGKLHEQAPALDEARQEFRDLWESINGPGSWAANPFVWVVKFKRVDQ